MPKRLYIGVSSLARSVTKAYVGVAGVARTIIKGYVGVGSLARECFRRLFAAPTYRGFETNLTSNRAASSAVKVGNSFIAVFGGTDGTNPISSVNSYGTNLVRSTLDALSVARYSSAAASVGRYGICYGGALVGSPGSSSAVDAYQLNFTHTTLTPASFSVHNAGGGSIGDYALFLGGFHSGTMGDVFAVTEVSAYNSSATKSNPTGLTNTLYNLKAASNGHFLIASTGIEVVGFEEDAFANAIVHAYNSALTRNIATSLTQARASSSAADVGQYVLFMGGRNYDNTVNYSTVDAYNLALTRSTPTSLAIARSQLTATSFDNDYAIAIGGVSSVAVDVYNTALTRSLLSLGITRWAATSAFINLYALIFGGNTTASPNPTPSTEAFQVAYV